ncbi:RraA family protein [Egicoccus halophilus]|uniref:Putative 4-hydroxy-4-methyl-2-oxoglutarate aldolase n=1 Tax=Egicoccus halophilus TaxID=1670830 RepID=A0A8J3ES97_9ACTN|nr:hypothetical protein [Egicoccus halophilus]GGI02474.1 hypothetical protein GCM10011354_00480 [Egicoccus halophilus]
MDVTEVLSNFGRPGGLDLEAISDACDALGVGSVVTGLGPLWADAPPFAGPAVTMELVCGDFPVDSTYHLGVDPILQARPGAVIVIDHRGREHAAGWGGLLSRAAKRAGVRGVVIDGAARDVLEAGEIGLPIYGTATVSRTARTRVVQRATQQPIDFRGVAVRPDDVVFAAPGGVAVVPAEALERVLQQALDNAAVEATMAQGIDEGQDLTRVLGSRYELMLERSRANE